MLFLKKSLVIFTSMLALTLTNQVLANPQFVVHIQGSPEMPSNQHFEGGVTVTEGYEDRHEGDFSIIKTGSEADIFVNEDNSGGGGGGAGGEKTNSQTKRAIFKYTLFETGKDGYDKRIGTIEFSGQEVANADPTFDPYAVNRIAFTSRIVPSIDDQPGHLYVTLKQG